MELLDSMLSLDILRYDFPVWYETELEISHNDPRYEMLQDPKCKDTFVLVPEEILGSFYRLGHTNNFYKSSKLWNWCLVKKTHSHI